MPLAGLDSSAGETLGRCLAEHMRGSPEPCPSGLDQVELKTWGRSERSLLEALLAGVKAGSDDEEEWSQKQKMAMSGGTDMTPLFRDTAPIHDGLGGDVETEDDAAMLQSPGSGLMPCSASGGSRPTTSARSASPASSRALSDLPNHFFMIEIDDDVSHRGSPFGWPRALPQAERPPRHPTPSPPTARRRCASANDGRGRLVQRDAAAPLAPASVNPASLAANSRGGKAPSSRRGSSIGPGGASRGAPPLAPRKVAGAPPPEEVSTPATSVASKVSRSASSSGVGTRVRSNRKIIRNALEKYCLKGDVNRVAREKILGIFDGELASFERFVIVFRSIHTGRHDFRALYRYEDGVWILSCNTLPSPRILEERMVAQFLQYNSGNKEFIEVPAQQEIHHVADAIFMKPDYLPRVKMRG